MSQRRRALSANAASAGRGEGQEQSEPGGESWQRRGTSGSRAGLNWLQQSRESGKPPGSLKSPGSPVKEGSRAAPGRAAAAPLIFAPRARCWLSGWDRRAGGCPAPNINLRKDTDPTGTAIPALPAWWPRMIPIPWATKEQSHHRSHPPRNPHLPHSPCQPKSLIALPRLAVVRKACFSH